MNYGYFRITKDSVGGDAAIDMLKDYGVSEWFIYFDYGNSMNSLNKVLDKACYYTLHILRLNDLGFQIQNVIDILERLYSTDTTLYISNREVDIEATIFFLKNKMNFYIKFDNHPELIFYKND